MTTDGPFTVTITGNTYLQTQESIIMLHKSIIAPVTVEAAIIMIFPEGE